MSTLFKFLCGNCGGFEGQPKSSISTDYSANKPNLKLPITSIQNKTKFNIQTAKNNEYIILEKSIFRILARIKHSYFDKKGRTGPKKSIFKSLKNTSLESMIQSPNKSQRRFEHDSLISGYDAKLLSNYEDSFFMSEKALKAFFENSIPTNLLISYSCSTQSEIFKEKVTIINIKK